MKKHLPWIITGVFAAYLLSTAPMSNPSGGDVKGADILAFSRLPVLANGRVKPIDTIARVSLLLIRGKQTIPLEGRTLAASEWLLDVMAKPEKTDLYKIFVINDPDVLGLLGKQQGKEKYFSFKELEPSMDVIEAQDAQAQRIDSKARNRFQQAIVNLGERVNLYQQLRASLQIPGVDDFPGEIADYESHLASGVKAVMAREKKTKYDENALKSIIGFFERYQFMAKAGYFKSLPPLENEDPDHWMNMGEGLMEAMRSGGIHPAVGPYANMMRAWRRGDAAEFNASVRSYRTWLATRIPQAADYAGYEARFNHIEPFYQGMILYVVVFLLAFASWLVWPEILQKSAFNLLVLAFIVHTCGLVSRIVLQGRPPVTNLYSSAIFVGWMAVLLGIIVEKFSKKGFGSIVAAFIGFATLIIAHHLAATGDTMEMMRAVLDSNFWLSTHVVAITIGYSSTFLAGTLAHVYIFRGVLTPSLNKDTAKSLASMTYGVVCFALFFSFVGTILGGIWADQSWGRFWGWDPKENGALLIVLWNAIILHARWGGFIRERGLMVMTVFGNIVTSLSWFGVNMLGIGLHSYGWMDQAFYWLAAFVSAQIVVMAMGSLPPQFWKSQKHGVPAPAICGQPLRRRY